MGDHKTGEVTKRERHGRKYSTARSAWRASRSAFSCRDQPDWKLGLAFGARSNNTSYIKSMEL